MRLDKSRPQAGGLAGGAQGALVSAVVGLLVWAICEKFFADADVPPQIVGLVASALGIVAGSLAPQLVKDARHGTHAHS